MLNCQENVYKLKFLTINTLNQTKKPMAHTSLGEKELILYKSLLPFGKSKNLVEK